MVVMLVEKDEEVRNAVAEAFTQAGLEVAELADARAALALPSVAGTPSVLVTNLDFGPDMDGAGVKLAEELQRRWPSLPVIYVSDRARNPKGTTLHHDDACISKPFEAAMLLQMVRDLRETYQAH